MVCITIKTTDKGESSLLYGPEVPAKKQRLEVQKLKEEGLAKGIKSVEVWSRTEGRIKKATVKKSEMDKLRKEAEKALEESKKSE